MASIRRRGNTIQIRVSCGYDINGKQIERTKSWTPPEGLKGARLEKEITRQAVLVEDECRTGQFLDSSVTLKDFTERWMRDYAETQLKEKSIKGYNDMLPRIVQALGHIPLNKLRPAHILNFYSNLSENGVRQDTKYVPTVDFKALLKKKKLSQQQLADKAGVSIKSIAACVKGDHVAKSTTDKISAALGDKKLFKALNPNGKLSEATILKYHRLLSSILTAAVHWQVIPYNPCASVKPPRMRHKEAAVLDEQQSREILDALEDEPLRYRTLITLILYSGIRVAEASGLTWDDIDFENGFIDINKTLNYTPRKGVYEDTPKSESSARVISIPPNIVELLKQYKEEQERAKELLGDRWGNSTRVFVSETGYALHPNTPGKWYRKFVKKHGLAPSHIHTLRHTMTTLLLANGVDCVTVSKRLGHASPATTKEFYAHANRLADIRAAKKMQEILP